MSWVKMDDQWPFSRKLRLVEPLDRLMWAMAIPYSSSQNTDGMLDGSMLEMVAFLAGVTKPYEAAERLVTAGLFDLDAGRWIIHDYLEFNPSAAQREQISAVKAEAGRKGGYAKAGKLPADSQHAASSSPSKRLAVPSRPVPSRPPVVSQSSGPLNSDLPAGPPTTDDDHRRAKETTELLGRADHTKAIADGVDIHNRQSHLEACIRRRTEADTTTALELAATHPDWDPPQIAAHITDPEAATKAARQARIQEALEK